MTDWNSMNLDQATDDAWAMLEKEKEKLAELGKYYDEASTTIRAKDQSLEMKFDGRGELTDLTFNTSKYREMPPAQLANVILETLRDGRTQVQRKVSELMGAPDIAGMDLDGLVTGKLRPDEMINALMGPMLETLNGFGVDLEPPKAQNRQREARENG